MMKVKLHTLLMSLLAWPAPYGTLDTATGRAILTNTVAESCRDSKQDQGERRPVERLQARGPDPSPRAALGLRR